MKMSFFNTVSALFSLVIGLGTHLFVKVPQPEDCKETFSVFKSSCHLLLLV